MSFFKRLKQGLSKTSSKLTQGLASLFGASQKIDADLLETLETYLLTADVGVATTEKIIAALKENISRQEVSDKESLIARLKALLLEVITPYEKPLVIDSTHKPFVILMVGINGAGKTTTIGKLAHQFQQAGKSVILAAGDTFRAAAVEQLKVWGERNHIPVIAQKPGADPGAVIFDAMEAARARGMDVLIADTAGRLHTQHNLMQELEKIVRVIKKQDPNAPHEVLMILDGSSGQNALAQVKQFKTHVPITGLAITKLDGSAKGGILFSIAQESHLPIRLIGVGEGLEDLQPFNAQEFVEALFGG